MNMYGPYADLVQEVIKFFNYGNLMTSSQCPLNLNAVLVNELPQDMWESSSGGKSPRLLEPGDRTYNDIQSKARGRIIGATPRSKLEWIDQELSYGSDCYLITIGQRLTLEYYDYAETIADDLREAARNRAVFGATDTIFERGFHVYQSGGMPVGYYGKYPTAYQIMALFPGISLHADGNKLYPTYEQYLARLRE